LIVEKLNEAYLRQGKKDREERPFKFGPSNLSDCLRKSAFLLSGMEPEPFSPEQLRVFELGHQRGAKLEMLAQEMWPDAQAQVPIRIPIGKFEIKGTADLWIPSLRTVVDFKTVGAYGAGLLTTEGVSEDYKLQVHAYRDALTKDPIELPVRVGEKDLLVLGMAHPEAIRACIIYECKDSDARKGIKGGQLIELDVPWTEELEERYQQRLMDIEGMLIRKEQGNLDPTAYAELPLDDKGKKSWKCRYCSIGEQRGGCYK